MVNSCIGETSPMATIIRDSHQRSSCAEVSGPPGKNTDISSRNRVTQEDGVKALVSRRSTASLGDKVDSTVYPVSCKIVLRVSICAASVPTLRTTARVMAFSWLFCSRSHTPAYSSSTDRMTTEIAKQGVCLCFLWWYKSNPVRGMRRSFIEHKQEFSSMHPCEMWLRTEFASV
jgi:hypothetical protein